MRFTMFVGAWLAVLVLTCGYVGFGALADLVTTVVERRKKRVLALLSIVLFESDEEARRVHADVRDLPKGALLSVVQSLAVDLDGGARDRLRKLMRANGLEGYVKRRAKSSRWRVRVQAAQLQYLISHPNYDHSQLLGDRHEMVRARAAESLTKGQAIEHLDKLMELLSDEALVVRLAAQEAVLDAGAAAVPELLKRLESGSSVALQALEVAGNLPDPRLIEALDAHASSQNVAVRAVAAKALGQSHDNKTSRILERLMDDDDELVRAAAIESAARSGSQRSVAHIGRRLSDRSWKVRREAGIALEQLGSAGHLVLRCHLDDEDPYARDMARQVLDAVAARSGLRIIMPLESSLSLAEAVS